MITHIGAGWFPDAASADAPFRNATSAPTPNYASEAAAVIANLANPQALEDDSQASEFVAQPRYFIEATADAPYNVLTDIGRYGIMDTLPIPMTDIPARQVIHRFPYAPKYKEGSRRVQYSEVEYWPTGSNVGVMRGADDYPGWEYLLANID